MIRFHILADEELIRKKEYSFYRQDDQIETIAGGPESIMALHDTVVPVQFVFS
jgi:hypothetical protein